MLVREWHSRWGMPYIITSDRGSQFVSDLSLEVCSLMGIARDPTTSYHPQHNGKIERMHQSFHCADTGKSDIMTMWTTWSFADPTEQCPRRFDSEIRYKAILSYLARDIVYRLSLRTAGVTAGVYCVWRQ